ncbi:MAG: endonuclease III [Thermoguttaceae bacterium]|nr:endonuclease III [Thermoguttaceae bacterium]
MAEQKDKNGGRVKSPKTAVRKTAGPSAQSAAPKWKKETASKKNSNLSRKKLVKQVGETLRKTYPNPSCALTHRSPFELLVATILSAQCTDKRVNQVTPELFRRFPDAQAFANADVGEIGEAIKSCGFYRSKALNISRASKTLVEKYGGQVPDDFQKLRELPGVGRKTANCVLGNAFGIASGFVVDTHVLRLSRKIGLSDETTPEKVEADLNSLFPKEEWIDASHRLIFLGRQYCVARRPKCDVCPLNNCCLKRP